MKKRKQETERKFFLLPIVYSGLIILLTGLIGCGDEKPAEEFSRPAKIFVVGEKIGKFQKTYPGQTKAIKEAELSFRVPGQLQKLPVVEGQKVKKGRVVAQLDPRDFNSEVSIRGAEYNKAEKEYQRQKGLFDKNVIAKAALETYRRNRDVALASLRLAQDALRDTSLRAPFDGVIGTKYVDNFKSVRAKQPIVLLQDLTKTEIVVYVSESAVASRREKETIDALVTFESIPGKKFPCKIKEFSTQPDRKSNTYKVTLVADIPEEYKVVPGMNVEVIHFFRYRSGDNIGKIFIPSIAVFNEGKGRTFVWLVNQDMRVTKKKVEVKTIRGKEIEVTGGLEPGNRVVVAGLSYLREGMLVRQYQ